MNSTKLYKETKKYVDWDILQLWSKLVSDEGDRAALTLCWPSWTYSQAKTKEIQCDTVSPWEKKQMHHNCFRGM